MYFKMICHILVLLFACLGKNKIGWQICAWGAHDQGTKVPGPTQIPHGVWKHSSQNLLYCWGLPHAYCKMVSRSTWFVDSDCHCGLHKMNLCNLKTNKHTKIHLLLPGDLASDTENPWLSSKFPLSIYDFLLVSFLSIFCYIVVQTNH